MYTQRIFSWLGEPLITEKGIISIDEDLVNSILKHETTLSWHQLLTKKTFNQQCKFKRISNAHPRFNNVNC